MDIHTVSETETKIHLKKKKKKVCLFASEGLQTLRFRSSDFIISKLTDTNTLECERLLTALFSNRKKWTADSTETLKSLLQTCG